MHKPSGTSTIRAKGVSATTITIFTIFSRFHGVCLRILELIATEQGTEKCRRQPEGWRESIGGSCMVLPQKLRKKNQVVRIRLLRLGDQESDPSEGFLGEGEFFLREEKREQEREMTMRLEKQAILVGIANGHDEQYPLEMVRALANRIVGQIIHERINNPLLFDARNPLHRHPPPKDMQAYRRCSTAGFTGLTVTRQKKDPQVCRRIPFGFTQPTMAHRAAMLQETGKRHILRPPVLNGGVRARQ